MSRHDTRGYTSSATVWFHDMELREEKPIRATSRRRARGPRYLAKVPHGEGGVVSDVKTFSHEEGDDLHGDDNERRTFDIDQMRM